MDVTPVEDNDSQIGQDNDSQIGQDSPRITDQQLEILSDSALDDSKAELFNMEAEALVQFEGVANLIEGINQGDLLVQSESSKIPELNKKPSKPESGDDLEDLQIVDNNSEVNLKPCEIMICDGELNELVELVSLLIELIEIRIANSRKVSRVDFLWNSIDCFISKHKVFEKKPSRNNILSTALVNGKIRMSNELVLTAVEGIRSSRSVVFDPGGGTGHGCLKDVQGNRHRNEMFGWVLDLKLVKNGLKSLPFDRGGVETHVVEVNVDSRPLAFY